jgi:hypothetical protein
MSATHLIYEGQATMYVGTLIYFGARRLRCGPKKTLGGMRGTHFHAVAIQTLHLEVIIAG